MVGLEQVALVLVSLAVGLEQISLILWTICIAVRSRMLSGICCDFEFDFKRALSTYALVTPRFQG